MFSTRVDNQVDRLAGVPPTRRPTDNDLRTATSELAYCDASGDRSRAALLSRAAMLLEAERDFSAAPDQLCIKDTHESPRAYRPTRRRWAVAAS